MSKYEKIVGVLADSSKRLREDKSFQFNDSYIKAKHLVVLERPQCENDPNYRHFATYTVIQDEEGNVLAYHRPSKNNESRLSGNVSIGVGGHINVNIFKGLGLTADSDVEAVFIEASLKEIDEELYGDNADEGTVEYIRSALENSKTILLYDNSNDVGLHHIAVIKRIVLNDKLKEEIKINDEIDKFFWVKRKDLQERTDITIENWSKLILNNWSTIPRNNCPSACEYGEYAF